MNHIDITIMGQHYKLACKEGEQRVLTQAVTYLDEKMCLLRDSAKIKGTDRIAVMAALSIAAELINTKAPSGPFSELNLIEVNKQITQMMDTLDAALAPQQKLF